MFNFHIPVENPFQQLETPNAQMLGADGDQDEDKNCCKMGRTF